MEANAQHYSHFRTVLGLAEESLSINKMLASVIKQPSSYKIRQEGCPPGYGSNDSYLQCDDTSRETLLSALRLYLPSYTLMRGNWTIDVGVEQEETEMARS